MNFREIAEHMVTIHGTISCARDWAQAHAASHIGRNAEARAHWDSVSAELDKMQKEKRNSS